MVLMQSEPYCFRRAFQGDGLSGPFSEPTGEQFVHCLCLDVRIFNISASFSVLTS